MSRKSPRRGIGKVIGLAPAGRVRAWTIAAAVTALRRAFPGADVWRMWPPRHDAERFVVWRRGGLRVVPAVFHRCADEAAVEGAIGKAAKRLGEGRVVELAGKEGT